MDTYSHHADGTRDIFGQDKEVLHSCFCSHDHCDRSSNVDVAIPYGIDDKGYLERVRQALVPRVSVFSPALIFWEFVYNAGQGEYGDKGLTKDCHAEIARIIKSAADTLCRYRLTTILCGGSRRDLATYIIPKAIALTAGPRQHIDYGQVNC